MKKALLYIHGKGGSVEEANHYQKMLPDYDIFGLDYQKNTPWETKEEFLNYYKKLTPKYKTISIIANSIGAYFAMNALSKEKIEQAFFISPIVDMEKLIKNMMFWAKITEQELEKKRKLKLLLGKFFPGNIFVMSAKIPFCGIIPHIFCMVQKII